MRPLVCPSRRLPLPLLPQRGLSSQPKIRAGWSRRRRKRLSFAGGRRRRRTPGPAARGQGNATERPRRPSRMHLPQRRPVELPRHKLPPPRMGLLMRSGSGSARDASAETLEVVSTPVDGSSSRATLPARRGTSPAPATQISLPLPSVGWQRSVGEAARRQGGHAAGGRLEVGRRTWGRDWVCWRLERPLLSEGDEAKQRWLRRRPRRSGKS